MYQNSAVMAATDELGVEASSGEVYKVEEDRMDKSQLTLTPDAQQHLMQTFTQVVFQSLAFIESPGFQYDLDNILEGVEGALRAHRSPQQHQWHDFFHHWQAANPDSDGSRWPCCQWHAKLDWKVTPQALMDPNSMFFAEVLHTSSNHSFIYKIEGNYPPVRYFSFELYGGLVGGRVNGLRDADIKVGGD